MEKEIRVNLKKSDLSINFPTESQDKHRINEIFAPYGLQVDEVIKSAQVIRYVVKIPYSVEINSKLNRATKAIQSALIAALCDDNMTYKRHEDSIIIERRGKFNVVPFGNIYTEKLINDEGFPLAIGMDIEGKPMFTRLEKAPHILVAGTTGSGKSELLHSFISSLILDCHDDNNIAITIIDMKGSEFNKYKTAYPVNIITDSKEAFTTLSGLCDIMDYRYRLFRKWGVDDIDEANAKGHNVFRIACVIDEFADLIMQNSKVEEHVVRIAQKARACGIHLIIGTQSPRRDVITGLIKANIPFKIALNTSNSMESRIILDEVGAENLYGKGDMLIKKGGDKAIRAQGCYVDDSDKTQIAEAYNFGGGHVNIYSTFDNEPIHQQQNNTVSIPDPVDWSKVDMNGYITYDSVNNEYTYPTKKEQKPEPTPQRKKRLGLFGTIKALWNASPYFYIEEEDK